MALCRRFRRGARWRFSAGFTLIFGRFVPRLIFLRLGAGVWFRTDRSIKGDAAARGIHCSNRSSQGGFGLWLGVVLRFRTERPNKLNAAGQWTRRDGCSFRGRSCLVFGAGARFRMVPPAPSWRFGVSCSVRTVACCMRL